MCNLCQTFGAKKLEDEKRLGAALKSITKDMLKGPVTEVEHLRHLVDTWMGFVPGPENPDDPEQAEAWERSHR